MLKKLLVVGVAAAVGIVAVNSTGMAKHVRVAWNKAKVAIENKVPLEDHIQALKDQVNRIQPDIEAAKTRVAEERVAVKTLKGDIAQLRERVENQKTFLKDMHGQLDASRRAFADIARFVARVTAA